MMGFLKIILNTILGFLVPFLRLLYLYYEVQRMIRYIITIANAIMIAKV